MQRREVQCIGSTSLPVADNLCDQQLKPPHRQECYNDKCKGVWRTDNWSEVNLNFNIILIVAFSFYNNLFLIVRWPMW